MSVARRLLLLVVLCAVMLAALLGAGLARADAATVTVSGTLTDLLTGEPIVGATIRIEDDPINYGAIVGVTQAGGFWTMSVPAGLDRCMVFAYPADAGAGYLYVGRPLFVFDADISDVNIRLGRITDHPNDNGQALDLSWEAVPDATNFVVWRGGPDGETVREVGTVTNFVDTNLTAGATYSYAVQPQVRGYETHRGTPFAPVDNGSPVAVGWALAGNGSTASAGRATIVFDEVTTSGTVNVTPTTPSGSPPASFQLLSSGWSIERETISFLGGATISFPYTDTDLRAAGGQPENLVILHKVNGTWTVLATQADKTDRTVSAYTDSFSPFALGVYANQPPVVRGMSASPVIAPLGSPVTLTGTFTDPDLGDTQVGAFDWGDGYVSKPGDIPLTEPTDTTDGTVTEDHVYEQPGIYQVSVHVWDAAQAEASLTYDQYVVVYDPEGGPVAGSGWISSPVGAYAADPSLTGKATFSFEAKYKKKAAIPSGDTKFELHVADFTFKSTSLDWLVVTGDTARLQGTGDVNKKGTFGFLVTVIEGGGKGKHHQDLFRIKIWSKATGAVVYDSQPGAADLADPTTVLKDGSIFIRK